MFYLLWVFSITYQNQYSLIFLPSQVAAMTLGTIISDKILLEDIYVHTTTTIVANNVAESGGSVTSELSAKSVQVSSNLFNH